MKLPKFPNGASGICPSECQSCILTAELTTMFCRHNNQRLAYDHDLKTLTCSPIGTSIEYCPQVTGPY